MTTASIVKIDQGRPWARDVAHRLALASEFVLAPSDEFRRPAPIAISERIRVPSLSLPNEAAPRRASSPPWPPIQRHPDRLRPERCSASTPVHPTVRSPFGRAPAP